MNIKKIERELFDLVFHNKVKMDYQACIEEYKTFQNEYDKIYLEDDCIWIRTGYGWSDKEIHIHYNHNYWGSNRFHEWLNKWNLKWEWYNVAYGYVTQK